MKQKRLLALLSSAALFMSSLSFPKPVIQAAAAETTDWEWTYNYILQYYEEDEDATYDLFDINGDHIPELFLTPDNYMNAETFIYSVRGTEIINLGPVCATAFYGLPDRNQLVCSISSMANGGEIGSNSLIVYELKNWELVPVKTLTEYIRYGTVYQYEIDGKAVSLDNYSAQHTTYMANPRIQIGHEFLVGVYKLSEISSFYIKYDSWQEAYYFLMRQYYYQHMLDAENLSDTVHFETFDLNGDGTQELVFSTDDFHYADVYIYTFTDGYLALAGILAGSWGVIGTSCNQKYIKIYDSHMGIVRTDIYQLTGKKISKVIAFEDSYDAAVDPNSSYYKGYRINGTAVSANEYEQKLQVYSEQTDKDSSRIGLKYVFSDLSGVENGWGYDNYFDHIIICYVTEDKASLTIPSELASLPVTELNNYCFTSCEGLQTVVMPQTIQKIDPFCFYRCSSLRSVSLPSSLKQLGSSAFAYCTSLESISVAANNPNFAVKNGVLFDKHYQELVQYPCGKKDTEYTVPDTVRSIKESAFLGTEYLRSVTLPESVTDINNAAFQDCVGLTDIYILNSACNIWDYWDDEQGYTINNRSEYDNETGNMIYYFDGTIHGYEDSTAEDYGQVHHRNFELIPVETTPPTTTTTATTTSQMATSSATTLSEQPQSIAGDLNGDQIVSVADAVLLTRFISEALPAEDTPPSDRINAADLDKDGLLTIIDVMRLLRLITQTNLETIESITSAPVQSSSTAVTTTTTSILDNEFNTSTEAVSTVLDGTDNDTSSTLLSTRTVAVDDIITNSKKTVNDIYQCFCSNYIYNEIEILATTDQLLARGWDKLIDSAISKKAGSSYELAALLDFTFKRAGFTSRVIYAWNGSHHYWCQIKIDDRWWNYDPTYGMKCCQITIAQQSQFDIARGGQGYTIKGYIDAVYDNKGALVSSKYTPI